MCALRLLIYVLPREIPRLAVQPKGPAAGHARRTRHSGITGNVGLHNHEFKFMV